MPTARSYRSPHSLKLLAPVSLTCHPAAVYLGSLAPGSRRTMGESLQAMARLLTDGECDADTLDWSQLRYRHTAAIRVALLAKYSPVTANKMLSALRRVLKEAYRLDLMSATDYQKAIDLPAIRGESSVKGRCLSGPEINDLLATCASDNPLDIRDKAIITLLRATGMRRSELVNLELRDLDLVGQSVQNRQAKGGKNRLSPLPDFALNPLRQWLKLRGDAPGALFCRIRRGGHLVAGTLHPDAIWKLIQARARSANLPGFSPHDFKRTFCSDLFDAGVDIVTIQKLAGHASPATTAKYDRRGEETKRKAVQKLGL